MHGGHSSSSSRHIKDDTIVACADPVDFCRVWCRPVRSQFAASEDEKRVDATGFHLTRGPLSVGRAASAAGSRDRRTGGAWIGHRPAAADSRPLPRGNTGGLDRASGGGRGRRSDGKRSHARTQCADVVVCAANSSAK